MIWIALNSESDEPETTGTEVLQSVVTNAVEYSIRPLPSGDYIVNEAGIQVLLENDRQNHKRHHAASWAVGCIG
jgi:hypothetical protein